MNRDKFLIKANAHNNLTEQEKLELHEDELDEILDDISNYETILQEHKDAISSLKNAIQHEKGKAKQLRIEISTIKKALKNAKG